MHWPLTRRMSPMDRDALLARCRRRRHAPGEVLLAEGAAADSLHLVVSGRVTVQVSTPGGGCATLALLGPGTTFGEVGLVSASPLRSATVVALEECETLTLHRRDFEQLRRSHPGVDDVLLDLLAGQVRRLTELLTQALLLPAEQRVLHRLLGLTGSVDGVPAEILVAVTQDALATMAGTSRVTTNQVLQCNGSGSAAPSAWAGAGSPSTTCRRCGPRRRCSGVGPADGAGRPAVEVSGYLRTAPAALT